MKITINRKAHFNSAHRLNNKNWSHEKNIEIFGKCNNPNYHGHNYELSVSIKGEIDKDSGFVMDLKKLKEIIKEEVEDRFDHKNLNLDVREFEDLNPTVENIAVVIWNILRTKIELQNDLKITLYETPLNYVVFSG